MTVLLAILTVFPPDGLDIRESVEKVAATDVALGASTILDVKQYMQTVSRQLGDLNPLSSTYFDGLKEYNLLRGLSSPDDPLRIDVANLPVGLSELSLAALVKGSGYILRKPNPAKPELSCTPFACKSAGLRACLHACMRTGWAWYYGNPPRIEYGSHDYWQPPKYYHGKHHDTTLKQQAQEIVYLYG